MSMEIFSVDEVTAINAANQKVTTYEPFYSLRHSATERRPFWFLARAPPPIGPAERRRHGGLALAC